MARHLTRHAAVRRSQRSIPPIVIEWLHQFGEEAFDGRGGVVRYFSHKSRRQLEHYAGRHFVAESQKYLNRYVVENASDGTLITAGIRYEPIRRR
jgi:hypothetical protein